MPNGSDTLMRCIHQLAAKEQRAVNLFVANQKAYFIAPNAIGCMQTEFSAWDFCKNNRTWLGHFGEGASQFAPKAECRTLAKELARIPDPDTHALYDALLPYRESTTPQTIVALIDKHGYEAPKVNALWSVPANILFDALKKDEKTLPPHLWEYTLKTKYWQLTFPGREGIIVERRRQIHRGETLDSLPYKWDKDHSGDTSIEEQLTSIMLYKTDIEQVQQAYRAVTAGPDATLK